MKQLKIILLLVVGSLLYGTAWTQVINVPNKSEKHFAEKYPDAKNVNWKNNVTDYSATFDLKDKRHKAHYHMDGVWDYTESFITEGEFPGAVTSSFKKSRFADWKLESTAMVENNKGEITYRYELKKGIERKYLFLDETGKEVKTTSSL